MASFALNLLGGFALSDAAGAPVALSSRKAMALLAYLACDPGQPVAWPKIAALLWADRGDEQARASLRQTLSVLSRALNDTDGEVLVSSAAGLTVDGGRLGTDVGAFEALAASDDRDDLQRAAELYKGPLLDGFEVREEPLEDWLRQRRTGLADAAARAMSALIERCEEDGDVESALSQATRLLAIDPLREDIHRAAMQLHGRTGRWNEAIRQYRACESVLAAELGVAPDDATVALHEEVLARRDRPTTTRAPPPGQRVRRGGTTPGRRSR